MPQPSPGTRKAAVLLVILAAAACRGPARPRPAAFTAAFPAAASAIPDLRAESGSVWFAERTQAIGSYLMELRGLMPLQFRPRRRLRFFVLGGRARVRVGAQEAVLEAGGFASVPPRATYRILPLDDAPVRLLLCLMPEGQDASIIEMPGVMKRLRRGAGP